MPAQSAAQPAASLSQWQELVDPTTNQKYYYNSVTQASSWTPPPGFGGYALPQQAIPQQAITSTNVVQKPQTFGLQVRTLLFESVLRPKRIRVRAAQGPRGMARGLVKQQVSSSTLYAFDGGAAQEEEEQSEEMKQVLRRQAQRVSGLQSRTSLSDSQREARAKARMQETHAKRVRAEIERKAKEEKKFLVGTSMCVCVCVATNSVSCVPGVLLRSQIRALRCDRMLSKSAEICSNAWLPKMLHSTKNCLP